MKQKLQGVLERVKDPETNMTVAQLGLVERIRYEPITRKLSVYVSPTGPAKACCTLMAGLLLSSTIRDLISELQREFPHLAVERAQ